MTEWNSATLFLSVSYILKPCITSKKSTLKMRYCVGLERQQQLRALSALPDDQGSN